jgi:hypothetical protein
MTIQQSKKRYRVRTLDKKSGTVISDNESSWAYAQIPTPATIGVTYKLIVEVTYLGDHQYKQPYAKRLAVQQKNEEKAKKREADRQEKLLVLRRDRIMNQIELAFAKNGKDAVKFVTCDECDAPAKVLTLTHENSGSTTIDPDQITGALCDEHRGYRPFKTAAIIECSFLEFFYDGVKQIYVNKQTAAA